MTVARDEQGKVVDALERQLPPDHALLFAAIRAEFDAKLNATRSSLMNRLLLLGIPVGAVGGFVAEMVRPGSTAQVALNLLPFV